MLSKKSKLSGEVVVGGGSLQRAALSDKGPGFPCDRDHGSPTTRISTSGSGEAKLDSAAPPRGIFLGGGARAEAFRDFSLNWT